MKKLATALTLSICTLTAAQAQNYAPPSYAPPPPSYTPDQLPMNSGPMGGPPMGGSAPMGSPPMMSGGPGGAQPYCREYQQKITIVGKTQTGYGMACLQPDGSWQLMPPNSPPNQASMPPNMAYVVRDNGVYIIPPQPFVTFEFGGGRHYYPREYTHYYPDYHWRHY